MRAAVVGQSEEGEHPKVLRARVGAEVVVDDDHSLRGGNRGHEPLELLADRCEGAVL